LKSINNDLVQKNVELEFQIERLRDALVGLTVDSTGIEQMKKNALSGYDIYRAKVINNSLTHADNYITLDKGEKDGIRSEMGVVDGNGVVGIVYMTSDHYSVVIPVLNSKSSISCKIKNSDYFGFLKWNGGASNYATVKDMPRHSLFSLGDTIVTSGHSAVFPSGIPVGTVEDISDSHDGLSYLLKVRLFTDFGKLNDVRVIAKKTQEEQLRLEKRVKR
jgi:rod shape-determining protein MreC